MRCPNCKTPVGEFQSVCDQCGFHLGVADDWFGTLPPPGPGLVDAAEVLTPSRRRRIEEAIEDVQRQFPQVRVHALTLKLPAKLDLATSVFWLFNRGRLCDEDRRGPGNHDVLLLLDVANDRAACMVGYGLEPFLPGEALDQLAESLRRRLRKHKAAGALESGIADLETLLDQAQRRTIRGFGLAGREIDPGQPTAETAPAAPAGTAPTPAAD